MRWKSILAACAALVCVGFASADQAVAFHERDHAPAGWGTVRPINHWVYYPRYAHNYHVDPYAYRHSPRGYYPYRNSHYWRDADAVRERNHQHYNHWNVQSPRYKYHPSWGKPKHWSHDHHPVDEGRRPHRWHY